MRQYAADAPAGKRYFDGAVEAMKRVGAGSFLITPGDFDPPARMWRFTKNNGITEGFHCKMKLIHRRAYGFRNFNNYRLRVIAHCG